MDQLEDEQRKEGVSRHDAGLAHHAAGARPGGTRGPCRLCRGCGTVALVDEAAGERGGDAAGCESCGKVSKVIVLEGDGRAADAG
ncbi:MAG: hypothetical protein IPJ41_08250 [Phycisphaerales bacterium]|nr:hypothetical protein [Phycisphaerales bacterium]